MMKDALIYLLKRRMEDLEDIMGSKKERMTVEEEIEELRILLEELNG